MFSTRKTSKSVSIWQNDKYFVILQFNNKQLLHFAHRWTDSTRENYFESSHNNLDIEQWNMNICIINFSAETDFRHQILTSKVDPRIGRIKR